MLKGEFSVGFTRAYCSGPSGEREPRHPAKDISLGDMDFHKIWQEQCEATRTIRERFGVKNALDYLVGEKLLTFARAADEDSEFAAELPRFQAAVWEIFNPYELRGYVASLKPAARKKLQKLLYVSS
jgi:hypothetical protein